MYTVLQRLEEIVKDWSENPDRHTIKSCKELFVYHLPAYSNETITKEAVEILRTLAFASKSIGQSLVNEIIYVARFDSIDDAVRFGSTARAFKYQINIIWESGGPITVEARR